MEQPLNPHDTYSSLLRDHQTTLSGLQRKSNTFGWLRLAPLLLLIVAFYLFWNVNTPVLVLLLLIAIAAFLILLTLDQNNKDKIAHVKALITVNTEELRIYNHDFTHRDDGLKFAIPNHAYAQDLDIFGRASLFQYVNRTNSEQGKMIFANWLLSPTATETIIERQEAAKELSTMIQTMQKFQAALLQKPLTQQSQNNIARWVEQPPKFTAKVWYIMKWAIPSFAIAWILLFSINLIATPLFNLVLFALFVGGLLITRKVIPIHSQLGKIGEELNTLTNALRTIEESNFKSAYLNRLSSSLSVHSVPASSIIRELQRILNRLDYRLNPIVFIPLNTILFWDLQHVLQLEAWSKKYGKGVSSWFSMIGEMEAVITLGTFNFNHPDYCAPIISDKEGVFEAEELGHPLIAKEKRVASSFATLHNRQISIITGSNMAGKSTFLRSVGINMVLSMMGAKACAKNLVLSHQKVISSMRITDNLEENTSTFYAELKKLKQIIDEVTRHEKVFLLLDEILRGTNSKDRHIGSKALIRQLLREDAVGIIATHDLELAKLEDDYPGNIKNYHFDVQVANEELYFDYKLKNGVCQSMNASILMKKIGISL